MTPPHMGWCLFFVIVWYNYIMLKTLKITILSAIILGTAYYTYTELNPVPCAEPIKYSLGEVNPGFNLSGTEFLAEIDDAAQIWSDVLGKDLFQYDPKGELKINLIYDYRQQTTNELKSLDSNIENNQESYNTLKARYQDTRTIYDSQKASLEAEVADYSRKQKAYNEQVAYWNAQGGAPADKYQDLQRQKSDLEAQRRRIELQQASLNKLTEEINNLVAVLNQLAKTLNLNIAQYNTVGSSLGEQFEEGVYVEDRSGKRIDIFEFQNEKQLTRLIAHELGHALGLEHVEDAEAIMNWLNTSENLSPTQADIEAVRAVCRIN